MASSYIPILRELAVLADGTRGAVLGPRGEVLWLCFPRFDSPSIFGGLMGGAGTYALTPQDRYTWGGFYEQGSLIWRSRWVLEGGVTVESRDALVFPSAENAAVLLRRIQVEHGSARLQLRLDPRPDFGRATLRWANDHGHGAWHGEGGPLHLRWSGAGEAEPGVEGLEADLTMMAGGRRDLVLELSTTPLEGGPPNADALWRRTERTWDQRVPALHGLPAGRDARHALAVITGLTTASGGMVAAATTSLPERADTGRNYDYRFVWIRDQSYAGQAAAQASAWTLLDSAVRFTSERLLEDGADLKPVYTIDGRPLRGQDRLDHLPGYPGGDEVMVGNHAGEQFQLDAFGEALLLLGTAARVDRLRPEDRQAMGVAADAIRRRWREPNAGIWETNRRQWTHSKLICAAGLRQAAAFAGGGQAGDFLALAEHIVADTAATALDQRSQRWQRADDDARLDAALLIPPVRGAVPAADPRTRATLEGVLHQLTEEGYCYRYRPDARPLGEAEGSFSLCNFWMVLALLQQGQVLEAARWFERARAACGPPGLFAEEYDVIQREMRGNIPQLFVHAGLLESAVRLAAVLD